MDPAHLWDVIAGGDQGEADQKAALPLLLAASGLDPLTLAAGASATFQRQAATAASVLSQDPDLCHDIQRRTPHRRRVYRAAGTSRKELMRRVDKGDRQGSRQLLQQARHALPEPDRRP